MDDGMIFENAVRLFLGQSAHGIAGLEQDPKAVRKELRKVLRAIKKQLNSLETDPEHKEKLMWAANAVAEELRIRKEAPTVTVYWLFKLVGQLLGYDYQDGKQYRTLEYFRTPLQYYEANLRRGGDIEDSFKDETNAISIRKEIVHNLKERGLSDFNISLALNTSEYEVRKLRWKG